MAKNINHSNSQNKGFWEFERWLEKWKKTRFWPWSSNYSAQSSNAHRLENSKKTITGLRVRMPKIAFER